MNTKRATTLLLCLLVAAIMAVGTVGCAKKEAAKDEDVIVMSLESDPMHLDESLTFNSLTIWSAGPINDYLVVFDEDMNIQKSLLEDYNMSDELSFHFTLRKGVKFHNGREVNAKDVKYSIERQLDPEVASEFAEIFKCVESVEVIDEYSGIIHLNAPFAPFLAKLTRIAIIPEEAAATMKTAPVGCGPYKFKEWKHDQYIELERFDDYWKEGYPKADRLIFKILPEYNSQRAALLSGEIDILLWLNNNDIAEMEKRDDVKVHELNSQDAYYLLVNCEVEPFNNPLVRKAISLSVDKEACLNTTLAGYADVLYAPLPNDSYFFDDSLKYDRDIEKAKALLAEAGYADGFTCKLITPQTTVEGPMGDLIQAQLAEVGITVEVEKLDSNIFLDRTFGKKEFEMMICGDAGDGDPETFAYNYLYSQSPTNLSGYNNEKFDQLMVEGRATYDRELRRGIYLEAYQLLMEDSPMTFIEGGKIFQGMRSDVEGFTGYATQRYEYAGVHHDKAE